MIGQMGLFPGDESRDDSSRKCYLHGYVSSRLMKLADDAVKRGEEGLPLYVAATKVDGFVLSLTPNSHNYNYRSGKILAIMSLCTLSWFSRSPRLCNDCGGCGGKDLGYATHYKLGSP
jgi:hypothetical protein